MRGTDTNNRMKVYVEVTVTFTPDGIMRPVNLRWENGYIYEIDRITEVRPAAAMKAGGQGDRYKITVQGKESFLFFEKEADVGITSPGKWFVERK